jgi:nucleoside-specific outer membrane channel protein Tsx
MTTVTLNHFSTWKYGDNFAFADFYRGQFVDAFSRNLTGNTSMLYAEWHPRLFLNKLGAPTGSIVKNWGLAGEINQSQGFFAYLGGLGLDLDIPGFVVAGCNLYYRYDNFAYHTWQLSPFWTVPFKVGGLEFVFTGFLDLTTNKDKKLDLMTQPELLLDVGALAGSPGKLHVGVEWYVHSYQDFVTPDRKTVSAPQVMVQWTPFTQFVP